MLLIQLFVVIRFIVRRIMLTGQPLHRQAFIDLSKITIDAQDRGVPFNVQQIMVPYLAALPIYVKSLVADRNVRKYAKSSAAPSDIKYNRRSSCLLYTSPSPRD